MKNITTLLTLLVLCGCAAPPRTPTEPKAEKQWTPAQKAAVEKLRAYLGERLSDHAHGMFRAAEALNQ
jgi:outer membrane biogenesis lipoprotein LolB